ncbi:hypothetical protein CIW83_07520 [Tissierella sp. P1]|jgi:hypothetical protein|uniref:hypothetical protein n=1 Tax=Tissierella TaxID=41273 RepID=UPI000B9FA741|nr:hypothetical protein [Tissierella sp. P1]MDU5083359.1 hypothetical protein [Bacillota bacterium]OZV12737.1 hypothetical protein CIW83_07520 [Tissierella sp. P1]
MQDLKIELNKYGNDLNTDITIIKERGEAKAIAKRDYRVALVKEILLLNRLSQLKYLESEIEVLKR